MIRGGRWPVGLAVALMAVACSGDDGSSSDPRSTTESGPRPADVAAGLCAATEAVGPPTVVSPVLTELSGLVASRQVDELWWAHNDSGNEARLHAVGPAGEDLGSVAVDGVDNVDWEDIAVGPGPDGDLLYVADIGNNDGARDTVPVHIVVEPDVAGGPPPSVAVERTIELTWPDGPRDAEVLLVDPVTSELVIVTRNFAGPSEVYTADGGAAGPTPVEKVGTVGLREAAAVPSLDAGANILLGLGAATGGDVTAAGDALMVRTYGTALAWPRRGGQSLAQAIVENEACEAPTAVERQGEAIAVDPDGLGYRTIGEGSRPPVNRFTVEGP